MRAMEAVAITSPILSLPGPVDPTTGMLINISEIKERAGKIVRERFDHKFLNEDNSVFPRRSADCGEHRPATLRRCRSAVRRCRSKTVRLSPD